MTGKGSIYLNGKLVYERKTSASGDVVIPLDAETREIELYICMQPDTKGHILLADIVYVSPDKQKPKTADK
jgi:hypothetical protein